MTKQKPTASTKTNTAQPPQQFEEEIRVQAYRLYEQRGRQDGRDLDDWLEAEAAVVAQSGGPRSQKGKHHR